MKNLLWAYVFAGCLTAGVSSLAYADDAGREASGYDWTGVYLGLQAGATLGQSETQFSLPPRRFPSRPGIETFGRPDPSGLTGGAYAGANYQFGNNIVIGIEAAFYLSGAQDSGPMITSRGLAAGTLETSINWGGSVGGRLGYAFDRWLPYATAGLSFADVDHLGVNTGPLQFGGTYSGLNVGAGLEYAFTDHMILRGEYKFSDFGREAYKFGTMTVKSKIATHDIQFGISYKF